MSPPCASALQESKAKDVGGEGQAGRWFRGAIRGRAGDTRLRSSSLAQTVSRWSQALPYTQASYFLPVR